MAGVAIVPKSPERREAIGKCAMPVAEAFIKEMVRSTALERRGLAGLREVLLAALPNPNVKQQAAMVPARQDEPLLAREVQERILRHFANERIPTNSLELTGEDRLQANAAPDDGAAVRFRSSHSPWVMAGREGSFADTSRWCGFPRSQV